MDATSVVDTTTTGAAVLDGFELVDTARGLRPDELAAVARAWVPAIVPGGVHESLVAAGRIDHPFYGRNEKGVAWIEERDWWFRTTFAAETDLGDDERLRLVFHGLDTVADVWLNGRPIGHHENMFRPLEVDVTSRVRASNELLVRFSPPLAGLTAPACATDLFARLARIIEQAKAGAPAEHDVAAGEGDNPLAMLPVATLRRKAAFSWGWDFGPRVPSVGIWRPVELRRVTRAAIDGWHVRTEALDLVAGTAEVAVVVETSSVTETAPLEAVVTLTSPSGRTTEVGLPVMDRVARGIATVHGAEPWWTHDLGTPALYDVHVELRERGTTISTMDDRVGLRTVAIDRSADPEGGRFFRFVLNGVPIFARGAAWLPASTMVGSVSGDRYRELVGLARDGGMTMLRVWGGGIYEHDAFYRTADEMGVLVWQDFMFACTDYPSDDPVLVAEVTAEAEYQVKRLRNHASLAIWAGNNEVQTMHAAIYQNLEPGPWGSDFFDRILPDAVERLDGGVPYWPGSPWGQDEAEGAMAVNGVLDGDRHAWEVWHGMDVGAGGGTYDSVGEARHYRRYANDRGKFISEFGIHASPVLSTLERWIPADELTVHGPGFDAHNKDNPKNKGDAILEIITGLPRTLEQYVDYTMASQAEGLKFGIEHYRRRQPHCSGTLIWQFNDVWPGFSWSVVDYETVPKAGYYAAARSFAPVLASFVLDGDVLTLWVSNSSALDVSTTATVTIEGFDGTARAAEQVRVRVPATSSEPVWSRTLRHDERGSGSFARVTSQDGAFGANRLFFAEVKDLPLPRAVLHGRVRRTGPTTARAEISAETFAYLVRVSAPVPTARFSDNYFDLPAGQTRTVEITGLTADVAEAEIRIGSYVGAP